MAVVAPALAETVTAAATRERYRFTRHVYHGLVDAGIFTEDSRVELIGGDIIRMSPVNSAHAGTLKDLVGLMTAGLAERAVYGVQDPIVIADDSEPQPDLTLCKPRADKYRQSHPTPNDIWLVVEVADSSLRYDREVKMPLYAAAGIVEMWLLDLNARVLEVYRTPSADGYNALQRLKPGDKVSPLAFPDLILEVAALLPPTEHGS
jgi:Uma2 family endonuclease